MDTFGFAMDNTSDDALPMEPTRSRRYTKVEWEAHRGTIVGMYPKKGVTIRELKEYMLREHSFSVTEKQLKDKLKLWGLRKNARRMEAKPTVRKNEAIGTALNGTSSSDPLHRMKINDGQILHGIPDNSQTNAGFPICPVTSIPSHDTSIAKVAPIPADNTGNVGVGQTRLNTAWESATRSSKQISTTGLSFENPKDCFQLQWPTPVTNCPMDMQDDIFGNQALAPINTPISTVPLTDKNTGSTLHAASSFDIDLAADREIPLDPTPLELEVNFPYGMLPFHYTSLLPSPTDGCASSFSMLNTRARYRQEEEEQLRKNLDLLEYRHGLEHFPTLETLSRLSSVLRSQGRYGEAETLLKKEVEVWQKYVGDDNSRTFDASIRLSRTIRFQGRLSAAEKLSKNTCLRASEVLASSHPMLLNAMEEHAFCLRSLCKPAECEQLFSEILRRRAAMKDLDNKTLLDSKENLGIMHSDRGNYEEGETLLREVLKSWTELHGREHSFTLRTQHFLARALFGQKRYEEASSVSEDVVAIRTKVFGPGHPDTLRSKRTLAIILLAQGKHDECEVMAGGLLSKECQLLGAHHPETLKWKKILVTALTKAGKFDDAEMLGKELCKETEQALGANHQNSLVCLQDLGAIYRSQGRLVEAISAFEKAFKGLTRILGSEHPFTKDALSAYSEVLEEVEEREVSDCI